MNGPYEWPPFCFLSSDFIVFLYTVIIPPSPRHKRYWGYSKISHAYGGGIIPVTLTWTAEAPRNLLNGSSYAPRWLDRSLSYAQRKHPREPLGLLWTPTSRHGKASAPLDNLQSSHETESRRHFLALRVINALPIKVVYARSVDVLKVTLDKEWTSIASNLT